MKRKTGKGAHRRRLLLGGVGAGLAGLLPKHLDDQPARTSKGGKAGDIGNAAVPSATVNLADFGGKPGQARTILVDAFHRAFAVLAESGGGTLLVPAGVYDFGSYANAASIILCRNVRNIAISAYGATFTATTTAKVVPHFFYFVNFHNVTIAGADFIGKGFRPWLKWKGMYCVGIQADELSSGFSMVDCYAEGVMGLLASHNNAASRRHLSDISVRGELRYSYYGVAASFIRERVHVELVCHNVRRAFIANSLRHAEIVIRATSTSDWPGSNGFVALVSGGASTGHVENVLVKVDVSGECIHSSYVHFYHQGPERAGYMRDIDATVNVNNVKSVRNLFVFDHENAGVRSTTARIWDRICLHGSVTGEFSGRVISNVSVTTSPGTVYLDRHLARLGAMDGLGAGFRVTPP